LLHYDTLT